MLKEQQRQILHDLSAAFVEVDRSFEALKASFNNRIAIQDELVPKKERFEGGEDQIFFLLDVQQRLANVESGAHRSLIDYNLALMEYARTSGSLLARYNIFLAEGPWSQEAQTKSRVNASRLRTFGPDCNDDGCDQLSYGPYDQTKPGPARVASEQSYLSSDPQQSQFVTPSTDEDERTDSSSEDMDSRSIEPALDSETDSGPEPDDSFEPPAVQPILEKAGISEDLK